MAAPKQTSRLLFWPRKIEKKPLYHRQAGNLYLRPPSPFSPASCHARFQRWGSRGRCRGHLRSFPLLPTQPIRPGVRRHHLPGRGHHSLLLFHVSVLPLSHTRTRAALFACIVNMAAKPFLHECQHTVGTLFTSECLPLLCLFAWLNARALQGDCIVVA